MAKKTAPKQDEPIEKQLWKAADKLRKNIDAAEYKHVVLGLIFLKYISDAFDELYYFERACETYITALQTGKPLRVASHEVAAKTARQWVEYPGLAANHFRALKDILDGEEPAYRD